MIAFVMSNPLASLPRSTAFIDPGLAGGLARVTRIGEVIAGPGYRRSTRGRDEADVVLTLTVAGQGGLETPDGVSLADLVPGTLLCFRGNRDALVYRFGGPPGRTWRSVFVNLIGAQADALADLVLGASGPVLPCAQAGRFADLVTTRLPASGWCDRRQTPAEALLLVQAVTGVLLESWRASTGDVDPVIDAAIDTMLARLEAPPGVAELAAAAGLTREHFTRRFLARTGSAPASWLRARRLERGRDLLRSTDWPVARIAGCCGFASAAAFAQSYRKYFGRVPRAER